MTCLQDFVGKEISQIRFVRDYLQIGIDGWSLTALGTASAVIDGVGHEFPDVGSRDAFCCAIGLGVVSVMDTPETILIETGYVRIVLSKTPDYGSEAVLLHDHDGLLLRVWP